MAKKLINKFKTFFSQDIVLLIAITLLSVITRLYNIGNKELWYDEALDIIQISKPVIQILKEVTITPIHYLIVHAFSIFSQDVVFLRLPSVLFGVLSVLLLYITLKKITDKKVALLSAFLFALSPMHIEFSQQILHYSFFIFFTILSLYFYFDIVFKPSWKLTTIIYFLLASFAGLATHLSSFLVIQLQITYFILYSLINIRQTFNTICEFITHKRNLVFIAFLIIIFIFGLTQMKYFAPFITYSTFNIHNPITLGFSLVSQLNTGTLEHFTWPFFKAMFIWFGYGSGVRLWLFLILFMYGIISLTKKPKLLLFSLMWLFGPFLILNITRSNHWFEEKYFIFIIPIYLYCIAEGIFSFINHLTVPLSRFHKLISIFLILAGLLSLAIEPIKIRTTYGYKVPGDAGYGWKKAIDMVGPNTNSNVDLFAIDDLFLSIYLGEKNRNKTWYSEESLIHYSPLDYQKLVNSSKTHYYITIPDIYDMRIGSVVSAEHMGIFGAMNQYKIKFLRETPITFNNQYIDNFMKMTYLKDASDWKNILMSFNSLVNIRYPQTEVDNLLYIVPSKRDDSYISYKFKLSKQYDPLLLRLAYFAKNKGELTVTTKIGNKIIQLSPDKEKHSTNYYDEIFDLTRFSKNKTIDLTFTFHYIPRYTNQLEVGIKSFALLTKEYTPPEFIVLNGKYSYYAGLEIDKNNKWWIESRENFGWVQTKQGHLYRAFGESKDPLVYVFSIPQKVSKGTLIIKSYTRDNTLRLSVSNDGVNFTSLDNIISEVQDKIHSYSINKYIQGNNKLYIRFQTDNVGQYASLKALQLTIQ